MSHDPDARSRASVDDTRCAEEIGRILMRDLESPVWQDERFLEWLAAETRATDPRAKRVTEAQARRLGEDLLARVDARLWGVRRGYRPSFAPGEGPRAVGVVELGVAAGVGRELFDEPAESWIELPAEVPAGEYLALRVVGDSMAPLMHTNDTVLVRRSPRVQRNTIIVARHPQDGYVCKRVAKVGREELQLESLAPDGPAMRVPHRADHIVGTVLMVWCAHRPD